MSDPRQMSFWDDEESELWDALDELLIIALTNGVAGGVAALPDAYKVLVDFDWVNQAVIDYARQYRYEWIKKINETTRRQVQQLIGDWIMTGDKLDVLESQLAPIFGAVRAEMIAATEVTRVYAEGNREAWESTGVVGGARWNTARDDLVCPICGPLDSTEIPLGDIAAYPPAHVRCRCWVTPIVSEEAVERRFAEMFA